MPLLHARAGRQLMATRKPQSDMTTRQIKALGRLGRTKTGRQIIAECREGILQCLVDGVGKP